MDFDLSKAPNTKSFVDKLTEIIEFVNTKKMQQLIIEKKMKQVEDILSNKFPLIMMRNYSLVMSIVEKKVDSFEILNKMINTLILVETKQITKEQANTVMHELLNELYVYNKFGGKDNFIKAMEEKHKNDIKEDEN
jgi:hypothetical protein